MNRIIFSFLLLFATAVVSAQSGKITGTVLNESGEALPSVNVMLKGFNKGATSDFNGNFEIDQVANGTYTVVFSYVGYAKKSVEARVSGAESLGRVTLIASEEQLSVITLSGHNGNRFARERSETVAKLPLKKIENPQVYNIISAELLQDQVVTNFDDALKNSPGIDKLWESTGRGGDGAGYFSLRGFAVQPNLVNGVASLTNGSPDPANIDNIEIVKGPSGTLYGSTLTSYGGLINVNTKRPFYGFGGNVSYTVGSYGLHRVTADVNTRLSETEDIAMRINTAYHTQNSYQDAGFRKSFFVAPSLSYQVNDKLSFFVNTEIFSGESTNQTMLFVDRGAPLRVTNLDELGYDNKRSYTGNDLSIKNPSLSIQAQMNYKISDNWTSQTTFSNSSSKSDGYYSYLYEGTQYTPVTEGIVLNRYISKQNSEKIGTNLQQNFIGDFQLGGLRNRFVGGLDFYATRVINNSSAYVGNGAIYIGDDLQEFNEGVLGITDPAAYTDDSGVLTQPGTDALIAGSPLNPSTTEQRIYSAYVSDVINLLPELSAMASLRVDHFVNPDADFDQTALSPKFGVVYQPILDKWSFFANYMNGFSNVAPIVDGGQTFNFDPEQANQFEVGSKISFSDKISATVSYYDIKVTNTVITLGPQDYTQGGERTSKGIEASITANPVTGLNIIAGFSHNDSELTSAAPTDPFAGRRPESAGPENLANLWASYRFNEGALRGFGFGFGGNYASENKIFNRENGTFTLPSYTVLNASAFYGFEDFRITLKLDNIANKEYYKGWSTISPQQLRMLSANVVYKF